MTKIFLFLSVIITSWNFVFFMHKNTFTPGLSEKYFSISMGLFYFITPLMLLMVIYVVKEFKKVKYVFVYPSFMFFVTVFIKPFEVVKDNGGWSYNMPSWFHTLLHLNGAYMILGIVLCFFILYRSTDLLKRERAKYIFYGLMIALAGEIIMTTFSNYHPETSSFSALFFSAMTLSLGYSASLTRKEVGDVQHSDESYFGLAKYYVIFLSKFKKDIEANKPSDEERSYEDLLKEMGLEEFDPDKNGFVFLGQNTFEYEKMKRYPCEILDVVEEISWLDRSIDELSSILLYTYNMIKEESEEEAFEWTLDIFTDHGRFMYGRELIDNLPIPFISVSKRGDVERVNDAFEALFCDHEEEMIVEKFNGPGLEKFTMSLNTRAHGELEMKVIPILIKPAEGKEERDKIVLFFQGNRVVLDR